MADCTDLDETSHLILARASERVNKKTFRSKTTITHISEELGLKRKIVQELIRHDLDEFTSVDDHGNVLVFQRCRCEPDVISQIESASRLGARASYCSGSLAVPSPSRWSGDYTTHSPPRRRVRQAGMNGRKERNRKLPNKPPDQLNSLELARHFEARMSDVRTARRFGTIGSINVRGLTDRISDWLETGLTPGHVFDMIEVFVEDPRHLREGVPAWKMFLGKRVELEWRAAQARTPDESDWVGSATPDDYDAPGGYGWD